MMIHLFDDFSLTVVRWRNSWLGRWLSLIAIVGVSASSTVTFMLK